MTSQTSKNPIIKKIEDKLKTVYDPEFPIIDIYTLGLIYDIAYDEKKKTAKILMTFTTPFCPMADLLQEMVKNAILEAVPKAKVEIVITFDPAWKYEMIKDKDLQRMFQ